MKSFFTLIIVGMILCLSGCSKYVITPLEGETKYKKYFDASIQLINNTSPRAKALPEKHRRNNTALGFILNIKNKTDKKLEINWNRTLFVNQEQTDGSFMFGGDLCADRNHQKIVDIIFPNASFKKNIYPSHLVRGVKGGGCESLRMGIGKFGILLSITSEGQEMQEKIMIKVSKEKK